MPEGFVPGNNRRYYTKDGWGHEEQQAAFVVVTSFVLSASASD